MKLRYLFLLTVLLLVCLLSGCGSAALPAESTTAAIAGGNENVSAQQAETSTNAAPVAPAQAAALYKDYLQNEGYREMLFDYDNPDAEFEAEACLSDVNEDGTPELLLKITEPTAAYASVDVLLGVRDGKVIPLGYASCPGGSSSFRDSLNIRFDRQTGKHVLEMEENARSGAHASSVIYSYYDCSQLEPSDVLFTDGFSTVAYKTAHELRQTTYAESGEYAENVKNIRRETDLFEQEDGFITVYTDNDTYISKANYDKMCARFAEPTDPAYQMKPVTLENPIPD